MHTGRTGHGLTSTVSSVVLLGLPGIALDSHVITRKLYSMHFPH